MKKLAFIALTLLVSNIGFGQSAKNHHQNHNKQNMSVDEQAKKESQRMTKELSLTSAQQQQWEQAARERITANEPVKAQMNGSTTPDERQQLKTKMRSNRDAFESKTTTMLTAEQKTKYEQLKKEHQQKARMHKGHGKPLED